MKPKVIDVSSTSTEEEITTIIEQTEEIEDSSTSTLTDEEEEIETIVEQIVCKMKKKETVEDKPKKVKRTKKEDLSNVKAEDIVEKTQPDKNVVTGNDFAKLTKKVLKLGATSLDFFNRKNDKYFVTLKDGKKIHFGSVKYEDYLLHLDEDRRKKYLARAKKITNKQKELSWGNPESANYWSVHLLRNSKVKD